MRYIYLFLAQVRCFSTSRAYRNKDDQDKEKHNDDQDEEENGGYQNFFSLCNFISEGEKQVLLFLYQSEV